MKIASFTFCLFFFQSLFSQPKNGNDLIEIMYKTYNKTWYKHFTFTQDAIFYKDGKPVKTEVWHEALSCPGKLIIKYDSIRSKNGVIFNNNTVTPVKEGVIGTPRPFIHDLLLVGFDVYFLEPKISTHLLDSLGYNLKIFREDVFDNRKVYVVGASVGDSTSHQFWIDKERLYLHKIVYGKQNKTMDVVFTDYKKMKGNWVATRVVFKQNGILQMEEKYYNINFPKSLQMDMFEPNHFLNAKW